MSKVLKSGWGYWDVSFYPYGGCFRRATADIPLTEVIEPVGKQEVRVSFLNSANAKVTAVVKLEAIAEV